MQMRIKEVTVKTLVFVTLIGWMFCWGGCGKTNTEVKTEKNAAVESQKKETSDDNAPKLPLPDEKELTQLVKVAIWKDNFAKLPYEVTDCTLNWVEKTPTACSGTFAATLKTTENLYQSVDQRKAVEKLGIDNLYEGELNVAKDKTYKLADPYKTHLQGVFPEDNFYNFSFYDVAKKIGTEEKILGTVELKYLGNTWDVQTSLRSRLEHFTDIESLGSRANRLDDPATATAIQAILQKRKDYVEKVDATILEMEKARQEALDVQKKLISEFIQPGYRYEGSFRSANPQSYPETGKASVVFGPYQVGDTIIDGEYFNPDVPDVKRQFTLSLIPMDGEGSEYPIIGTLTKPPRFSNDIGDERLYNGMLLLMNDSRSTIGMKFENGKLIIGVFASGWGTVYLDMGQPIKN